MTEDDKAKIYYFSALERAFGTLLLQHDIVDNGSILNLEMKRS